MPIENRIKKSLIIVFALFTAAYIFHNLFCLSKNNSVNCLEASVQSSVRSFYFAQRSPGCAWGEIERCIGPGSKKRGIYDLFCMLSYSLFGVSAQSAVYANFFLLILLLFSVYKIGKIVKDGYLGLLACFQLLMYPAIFGFLRISFASFATTAFVAFGMYCLLSSDNFRSIYKIVLLALCAFILLKLKVEKAAVYLFAPVALYLFHSFKASGSDRGKRRVFYRNLLIFGLMCAALLIFFTSSHAFLLKIKYYLVEVYGATHSLRISPHPSAANTALLYLRDLYFVQAGEFGFILFAIGAVLFLMNRMRYRLVLVSWILVPYLFYSAYYYFSGIHASYYIIEYMPAIALVSSCGIYYICRKSRPALRIAICLVYVSLCLFNYAAINYYDKQLPFMRETRKVSFIGKTGAYSPFPDEERYFRATQEIIDRIIAVKGKASVAFVNHYYMLLGVRNKIYLHNLMKKNTVYVYDFSERLFNLEKPDDAEVLYDRLKGADLIVDGNRFYPDGSFSKLKNYVQFGTAYDFSQMVRLEEKELDRVIGHFVMAKEIKDPKVDITFFLNEKINAKLQDASGAAPRQEVKSGGGA
jgi:4-amino-4-deoxy-L-arabinose transferase-like glycosyltransferase